MRSISIADVPLARARASSSSSSVVVPPPAARRVVVARRRVAPAARVAPGPRASSALDSPHRIARAHVAVVARIARARGVDVCRRARARRHRHTNSAQFAHTTTDRARPIANRARANRVRHSPPRRRSRARAR
jgi:hypothetical protein